MLDFWKGTSEEKLEAAEAEMVKLSGISIEEFESYPVYITFTDSDWDPSLCLNQSGNKCDRDDASEGETAESFELDESLNLNNESLEDNEYIWTYQFGSPLKPTLVLIHGFGGSGLIFYRMFRYLKEHFHVYLIDLMGWARSSRHEFKCTTEKECELYYANSIEKWRINMGFDKLNILAHSFGGFVASKYALYYPENINKLMLFSPHGVEITNDEAIQEKVDEICNESIIYKSSYKFFQGCYNRNYTPFWFLRLFGRISYYYLYNFMTTQLKMENEELEIVINYFYQILMQEGSGEYSFVPMFPKMWFTDEAILGYLGEYKNLDISFYYGNKDWIDSSYSGKKCSEILIQKGIRVFIVPNSGHHIYNDNPEEATKMIVKDFQMSGIGNE